jgi:hypothetical protein
MDEYTAAVCTHVAVAMTARPIIEASSTRHPNCSRMGMRILTMTLRRVGRLFLQRAFDGEQRSPGMVGECAAGADLTQLAKRQGRADVRERRVLLVGRVECVYRMPCSGCRGSFADVSWRISTRCRFTLGQARWSECTTKAARPEAAERVRSWVVLQTICCFWQQVAHTVWRAARQRKERTSWCSGRRSSGLTEDMDEWQQSDSAAVASTVMEKDTERACRERLVVGPLGLAR